MAIALLAILIFICLGAVYYLHSEINTHSLVLRKMNSDIQALMQRPMQIFPSAHQFSPPSYIPAVDDDGDDDDDDDVCVEDTDSDSDAVSDATEEIVREEEDHVIEAAPAPAPEQPPAAPASEVESHEGMEPRDPQDPQEPQEPQDPQDQEKKPSPPDEPAKNYDEGYEMEHEGVVYQVKQDKNGRKRWAKKSNKPTSTSTSTTTTLNLMD